MEQLVSSIIILLLAHCTGHSANPVHIPSSPETWGSEISSRVKPTAACPGGEVASLRTQLEVSSPFTSPAAFSAATGEKLPELEGTLTGDTTHQFSFHAELPDGTVWGFSGFLLARGPCIIHAQVTSIDG